MIDTLHNALFYALKVGVGEQQSRSLDKLTKQAIVRHGALGRPWVTIGRTFELAFDLTI